MEQEGKRSRFEPSSQQRFADAIIRKSVSRLTAELSKEAEKNSVIVIEAVCKSPAIDLDDKMSLQLSTLMIKCLFNCRLDDKMLLTGSGLRSASRRY